MRLYICCNGNLWCVVVRVGKSWRLMNSGDGCGRTWPGHLLFLAASHILASLDASQSQRIEYLSFSLPQQRSQGWPEDAMQLTKSLISWIFQCYWYRFVAISTASNEGETEMKVGIRETGESDEQWHIPRAALRVRTNSEDGNVNSWSPLISGKDHKKWQQENNR